MMLMSNGRSVLKITDGRRKYPNLKTYSDRLEERGSFKETVPKPQTIKDKIV
jgi:hypothetical protein